MTNSYNFQEAPDFAEAISRTYESVNQSYDRRESLERENDRTREINAAMPLKVLEGLADFSLTAKKILDKKSQENFEKWSLEGLNNLSEEEEANREELNNHIWNMDADFNKIEAAALEDNDIVTLQSLDYEGVRMAKKKAVILNDAINAFQPNLMKAFYEQFPNGTTDVNAANKFFQTFYSSWKQNLIDIGYNDKYIDTFSRTTILNFKNLFDQGQTQNLIEHFSEENRNTQIFDLQTSVFNNIDPDADIFTTFETWAKDNKPFHGNNIADTMQYGLELMLEHVNKTGDIKTLNKIKEIIYGDGDGTTPRQSLSDYWVGDNNLFLQEIGLKIQNVNEEVLAAKLKEVTNERNNLELKFDEYERSLPNGQANDKEILQWINENWGSDVIKRIGLPTEAILEQITFDDYSDKLLIKQLDVIYNSNEPYANLDELKKIIRRINDEEKRDEYFEKFNFKKGEGNTTYGYGEGTSVFDGIKINSSVHYIVEFNLDLLALDDTANEGNPKYREGMRNLNAYFEYWFKHLKTLMPEEAAFNQAETIVANSAKDGTYVTTDGNITKGYDWFVYTPADYPEAIEKEFTNSQLSAELYVRQNPTLITQHHNGEGIIYGFEPYMEDWIKEYEEKDAIGEVFVPDHIVALADKLSTPGNTINPHALFLHQRKEWAAANDLDLPQESLILQEINSLPLEVQELLNFRPDSASITEAFIRAYSPDSEDGNKIGFMELESVHPELLAAYNNHLDGLDNEFRWRAEVNEETGTVQFIDKDVIIHEYLQPEEGDWMQLSTSDLAETVGAFTGRHLENKYIVFKDGQWVLTDGFRGRGNEWKHNIDGFTVQEITKDENYEETKREWFMENKVKDGQVVSPYDWHYYNSWYGIFLYEGKPRMHRYTDTDTKYSIQMQDGKIINYTLTEAEATDIEPEN